MDTVYGHHKVLANVATPIDSAYSMHNAGTLCFLLMHTTKQPRIWLLKILEINIACEIYSLSASTDGAEICSPMEPYHECCPALPLTVYWDIRMSAWSHYINVEWSTKWNACAWSTNWSLSAILYYLHSEAYICMSDSTSYYNIIFLVYYVTIW